ncbi:cAMP-dependent protein kinase type II regulatory subunit-like isoform X2 [Paramacrobiotus metropolitanus]|nr:cAMP-dependent protein kinase type II regulatory subunit-like isoform X2 [Paramacrobiotus metropolitanus]XP_055338014.1 cAMP-dependent protein kinase type II regulatory subunit-like isoform X2 [Paramacrobiotus metropolitanus]
MPAERHNQIPVPDGLRAMLQKFVVSVLREKVPSGNLVPYAAAYFSRLNLNEEASAHRTGSMTARVVFRDDVLDRSNGEHDREDQESPSGGSYGHRGSEDSNELAELQQFQKQKMRRRQSVSAESFDPSATDEPETEIVHYQKDEHQLERLKKAVQGCFLFRSLDSAQLLKVLNALFEVDVTPGTHVIDQGDENADNFYVVESGIYDVYVNNALQEPQHCWEYDNSGSFGELALMYNQPRAATVVARTAGKLWALDRQTFQRIVLKAAFKKRCIYMDLIDNVDFLAELHPYEKQNLCDALQPKVYHDDDIIVRQGDFADGMYFIESGEVVVTRSEEGVEKEIDRLTDGQYFGELALITQRPRAATVVANGECKVAFLDVKAFERLLGPCVEIMKRNIDRYRHQLERVFGQSHLLETTEL